jgi:3-deoxy-manno-octulosonate cytidylyltransferase (CMP-KDO synthetase)
VEFHVVIPARHASTRLPGKPLLDIAGRPMIQRVVEQACASSAAEVLVATDHERIAAVVRDPRRPDAAIAVLTDPALASGTDRVAAVAVARNWPDSLIVVNVQGDEPFLPPRLIDQAAATLDADPLASIATLATPIASHREFIDQNVVKVVTDLRGRALYFSRAAIPCTRDTGATEAGGPGFNGAMRHIGIYAYRVGALRALVKIAPSPLEQREKLEQLRALQNGLVVAVARAEVVPEPGVDTESDLRRARARGEAFDRGEPPPDR